MRDGRVIRYYASIPKLLLLLIGCGGFVVGGWSMLHGGNVVMAWLTIVFFGLCALAALAMLAFAVLLRRPLLAIDPTGVTARQPLVPWVKVFVPWPDIAYIGVRTRRGGRGSAFSTLVAYARDPDRYSSPRAQRFVASYDPTLQGIVISAPLSFLFVWVSRKRQESLLRRIQQTFAPEIIQHGIVVDDSEWVV